MTHGKERTTETATAYQRRYRRALRYEFIAEYGGKCACCGEAWPDFLTISHRLGDGGGKGRPRDPSVVLRALKKAGWPKDIGVTIDCYNCNMGAARNDGVCPHVKLGYPVPVRQMPDGRLVSK